MLKSNVAGIDCRDCEKHVYDLKIGKREEYPIDDDGTMRPVVRDELPPCEECPKGEMDLEGNLRLHIRNHRALRIYQEQMAFPALPLPKHFADCAIFAENMHTIHMIFEEAKNAAARTVEE